MANDRSLVQAEDLYRLQLITGFDLSPDGKQVVFSLMRVDRKTEKKYSNLWVVPARGGRPRQFTYGDHSEGSPRWSPDGKQIAFISNRGDEKQSQLCLIPFSGGEARRLTTLKGTIGSFEWSPDRRQFVLMFRKKDKEEIVREKSEDKKKLGVVAREISRVFFKMDDAGYLPKEREHIWTVNARTGRARQLTDDKIRDEWGPRWSPDGRQIVFASNRSTDPDLDPYATDLFVIPATGGKWRKLNAPLGPKGAPVFSPDGRMLAYYGVEGRFHDWKNTGLWVVPIDGSARARNLTAKYDIDVGGGTINDVNALGDSGAAQWSPDSGRIFFTVGRHGNCLLKSIARDGSDLQDAIGGPGAVTGFRFDRAGRTLAWFQGLMKDPGQLWAKDTKSGHARPLTSLNRNLLDRWRLGEIEEVWFKGAAGNDLQGWILKPPGFKPGRKYPSIMEIHGGPRVQYGNFFMHEFFFLAAHGYVVYFCNPRGGQGYGEKHSKAIWNNWGTVDYEDLMKWADCVARKPYIDPDRMGVTGGSYGGYMTNWIIGHTDRFKAAVTQRSVSNLISMWGSSDFNWAFQVEVGNKAPWQNVENYWRQSPMRYIGNARTPTMVLHNEMDLRCAIEQGEQVFVALKKLGVDTEMVRFPDEPHGLSRHGRTDRRIVRLKSILRWFDKYLKG